MTLRPGGFPEYNPTTQILFDQIKKAIENTYALHGYQHIRTPAVEKTDTLKKGGDEVSNQIFGLYGLAQGGEDLKDYSLHFDLTVPFARYVLDRQQDLAFPFKRYQIQPVRRGERSQKGRYKEFRQADIDAIWKGSNSALEEVYSYDIIATLSSTIEQLLASIGCDKKFTIHINHKGFLQEIFKQYNIQDTSAVLALFDKYYKMKPEEFYEKLSTYTTNTDFIKALQNKNFILPPILQEVKKIGTHVVFDPFIVRGLDYYTGVVFETFFDDHIELGSFCSGGAYENFTQFLDPKQVFSGVGGSIGLSRLFSILTEEFKISSPQRSPSYLFLNFSETALGAKILVEQFHNADLQAELYPTPEKIDKQYTYAERKNITHVISYGKKEQKAGILTIKNIQTQEISTHRLDQSFGIACINNNKILLIQHHKGHRSIPKGHAEPGETSIQSAIRECKEETGLSIQEKDILNSSKPLKEHFFIGKEKTFKEVQYFIAHTDKTEVTPQPEEVKDFKRCSYQEALTLATHPGTKKIIYKLQKYLS